MEFAEKRRSKFTKIIIAYPFVLLLVSTLANLLFFGIAPASVALPSQPIIGALIIATTLLVANHTWLMTSTELTRLRFDMHATPEEWEASGRNPQDASSQGLLELKRRHSAHTNTTENTVYFAILGVLMAMVTPVETAALVWITGFAIGRLGHTFCYLTGRDGSRGIFMSISLLALYGLASYLSLSLLA